jgi:hypothetical protein
MVRWRLLIFTCGRPNIRCTRPLAAVSWWVVEGEDGPAAGEPGVRQLIEL